MPYRARDYYTCPDCKKRGVSLRLKSNGEDNYACRYCPWFVFILSNLQTDKDNMLRLKHANHGREF